MNKITLQLIGIYKDGGTKFYIEEGSIKNLKIIIEVKDLKKYYIDGRFKSPTKGELFDRYPSEEGAVLLDKSLYEFLNNKQ